MRASILLLLCDTEEMSVPQGFASGSEMRPAQLMQFSAAQKCSDREEAVEDVRQLTTMRNKV